MPASFEAEYTVRKLLVASQKGGVGKTTTSINLAAAAAGAGARVLLLDADPLSNVSNALNLGQHPRRRTLRDIEVDLPGVICTEVAPRLDVVSPYEFGSCNDAQLDELIGLFDTPPFRAGYDCLIVDAPPFLGANPAQLLGTADEFVLVLRAEALAHRTLPAFQELVQRSRKGQKPTPMKGILLTLPEGEAVGGRWEREMRGRLGTRILSQVIPHDGQFTEHRLNGRIESLAEPDSPAARAYGVIAESLGLAGDRQVAASTAESIVLTAAAAHQRLATRQPVPNLLPEVGSEGPAFIAEVIASATQAASAPPVQPSSRVVPAIKPQKPSVPAPPAPAARPRRRAQTTMHGIELPPVEPPKQPARVQPTASRPAPSQATPAVREQPVARPAHQPWWIVWTALGILVGVGMRFVEMPTNALPIAVGLAVTTFTVLVLKLILVTAEAEEPKATRPTNEAPKANGHVAAERRPSRPSAKNSSQRLSALARRAGATQRLPDADAN